MQNVLTFPDYSSSSSDLSAEPRLNMDLEPDSVPATSVSDVEVIVADISSGPPPGAESFCAPTVARNVYWNWTRAGHVAIVPCPHGATGQ
jgi:hypothetical protein